MKFVFDTTGYESFDELRSAYVAWVLENNAWGVLSKNVVDASSNWNGYFESLVDEINRWNEVEFEPITMDIVDDLVMMTFGDTLFSTSVPYYTDITRAYAEKFIQPLLGRQYYRELGELADDFCDLYGDAVDDECINRYIDINQKEPARESRRETITALKREFLLYDDDISKILTSRDFMVTALTIGYHEAKTLEGWNLVRFENLIYELCDTEILTIEEIIDLMRAL